jgi:hypothetical protein
MSDHDGTAPGPGIVGSLTIADEALSLVIGCPDNLCGRRAQAGTHTNWPYEIARAACLEVDSFLPLFLPLASARETNGRSYCFRFVSVMQDQRDLSSISS